MHKEEIEKYDELHSKLLSLKTDFQILSGKKPNDNVNEFKLSIINKFKFRKYKIPEMRA